MNKKYYQILGFFGVVCFLFGTGFYLVKRELSLYVILNVLGGLGLIGAFIYYNVKDVSKLFATAGRKGSKDVLLHTALVLGVLVALNLFSSLVFFSKDLTRDKVSSISEHSQKVIQWVKEPIEVLVFSPDEDTDYQKYLLDSYHSYNHRISCRFLDPEKNPQLAQQYGVTRTGQAVVTYKDSNQLITAVDEQNVTNAVIRLTQNVKNYVYFIYGHGEHSVDDMNANQGYGLLWRELLNENYYAYKLKLEPPNYYIPGNCTILIVAGPRQQYTEFEVKAIREYLENGGRAVFLLDPNVKSGLEDLVKDWGITLHNDCMVDVVFPSLVERAAAMMEGRGAAPRPVFQVMVKDFPEHEITQSMKDKSAIMSVARSMVAADSSTIKMDLTVDPIAKTTDKGWGETNLEGLFQSNRVSGAVNSNRGPLTVAMLSTKGSKESNSKVLVFGDSDFVNNEFLHQLYNRDLFMNGMAYLSKQANFIAVRPRRLFASRLDYDAVVMTRIFTVSVLVFPQLLLMAGIAIWWQRRS